MEVAIPGSRSDRLADEVVIVTGAGTEGDAVGIGRAIAIQAARAGAKVCAFDVFEDRAQATARLIEHDGGTAFACAGDVSDEADAMRVVGETVDRYGRLDVLVNNAAIIDRRVQIHEVTPELIDRVFAVNTKGVMLMAKAALPQFFSLGRGAIVNISSVSGNLAIGAPVYDASKAAMSMLTRDLALTYGRQNIRCNSIGPGRMPSPMLDLALPAEHSDAYRKLTPLATEGSPWDIAFATVFLASDEARFISGAFLAIDGGASAGLLLGGYRLLND